MQKAGVQFHEGIPEINHLKLWPPHGRLLVLDDLMAEGRQRAAGFIRQTFSPSKYYRDIPCQDMFPPGK